MKKIISLLLAIVMVFSAMPVAAFADETAPTIIFETTFTDEMTEGDEFTVTAKIEVDSNPGFNSFALPLIWNEDVLEFNGFEMTYDEDAEEDVLYTEALSAFEVFTNGGNITGARAKDTKKDGILFVANFTVKGPGDLDIGFLMSNPTDTSKQFQMGNNAGSSLTVAAAENIDDTAIEGLAVAADEPVGPAIPDGAPFTAVTTDAGDVIAVEQWDALTFDPFGYGGTVTVDHYHITIPGGANFAYVKFDKPLSTFMHQDYMIGEREIGGSYGSVNHDELGEYATGGMAAVQYAEDSGDDYTNIIIPLVFAAGDFSGSVFKLGALKTDEEMYYAVGPQDSSGNNIVLFSLEYASDGGEDAPTTYRINIAENIVGGTVSAADESGNVLTEAEAGTIVYLKMQPDNGYKLTGFSVADSVGPIGVDNGFFQMPAGDVTITAAFAPIHTCTYDQEVADEKYLKSEATCLSGAVYYKSCTCGEFAETAETFTSGDPVGCSYGEDNKCIWCGEAAPTGYFFATSADVSAENGGTAVVSVKITGHSDENVTGYNAYDVTLTFDTDKLELATDEEGNYIYSGAVKTDNGSVTVNGKTIRIVGCGADKAFGTEIAALTFKTKAEGNANVTISKVQVSDNEESVKEDAPEATPKHDENDTTDDTTPDQSVVLVPYTVTKPDFVSGETSVLHGEDYTFSYTDTVNYTYSGLKVTVGGTEVTPTEAEGVYTVANVTGTIVITATQTAKSYSVTVVDDGATVNAPKTATYGEAYAFTVEASEGKDIDTVKITKTDDATAEISYTINENGEYEIAGTDITADFTINVTQKDEPVAATTTITFTGVEAAEVEGGLTQTATVGRDFTFRLNKAEGFTYTAKVGQTDLAETAATETAPAFFTIPANLVVEGGVTVTITKTAVSNLKVEVSPYFNTDGAVMFLVIAKDGEKVLTYGEEAMFYSDKYALTGEEAGAYCWLVSSGDDADTVKAAAVASIKAAEETVDAPVVAYDCDVNQTTKVDVNDAQLAYDMYKGVYRITESVTMDKFLEADISTDRKLDVNDVAAIINVIVNGTSN